jgi:hypothetical protein
MASLMVQKQAICEPLTLAEAKNYLRVIGTSNDDIVTELITAAREHCELVTRRSFINKSYIHALDLFPDFTDSIMSQPAASPAYDSLPRSSTTLWNYSQLIKLRVSPLAAFDQMIYRAADAAGTPTALVFSPSPWVGLEYYRMGAQIRDANGTRQTCSFPGTTGSAAPAWQTARDAKTKDGEAEWNCEAEGVPLTPFILDPASEPARLFPAAGGYWPPVSYGPDAVRMYYTAGYNDDAEIAAKVQAWTARTSTAPDADDSAAYESALRRADVPGVAKSAMLACIALWYEQRESFSEQNLKQVPQSVDRMLGGITVMDSSPTRG